VAAHGASPWKPYHLDPYEEPRSLPLSASRVGQPNHALIWQEQLHWIMAILYFLVGDSGFTGRTGRFTGASGGRSTKAAMLVPRRISRLSCSTLIPSALATREILPSSGKATRGRSAVHPRGSRAYMIRRAINFFGLQAILRPPIEARAARVTTSTATPYSRWMPTQES
jgi:hypothetical protein